MNLLVTGGTGFIGSHFLNLAASRGHRCIAIKRASSTSRIVIDSRVEWYNTEIDQLDKIDLKGESIDCLLHFAAYGVSPQPCEWSQAIDFNCVKSMEMMKSAMDLGVNKFILCGSCMEYGISADSQELVSAMSKLSPQGAYAASKAAQSILFEGIAREKKLFMTIMRPFTVYGEGQDERNFWPSLRKAAISGEDFSMTMGEQIRDFTPVKTLVDAFLHESENKDLVPGKPKIMNVGTGIPTTLRDFAMKCWNEWGAKGSLIFGEIPYRDGEVMRYVPDLMVQQS